MRHHSFAFQVSPPRDRGRCQCGRTGPERLRKSRRRGDVSLPGRLVRRGADLSQVGRERRCGAPRGSSTGLGRTVMIPMPPCALRRISGSTAQLFASQRLSTTRLSIALSGFDNISSGYTLCLYNVCRKSCSSGTTSWTRATFLCCTRSSTDCLMNSGATRRLGCPAGPTASSSRGRQEVFLRQAAVFRCCDCRCCSGCATLRLGNSSGTITRGHGSTLFEAGICPAHRDTLSKSNKQGIQLWVRR